MITGFTSSDDYDDGVRLYAILGSTPTEFVQLDIPKERTQALREWMTRVKDKNLPSWEIQDEFDKWYVERTKLIKDIKSTLGPLIN